MQEVPPHPFKNSLTKTKGITPKTRTDSWREPTLAFAHANSQAPPRPCSLRELIRITVGRGLAPDAKKLDTYSRMCYNNQ